MQLVRGTQARIMVLAKSLFGFGFNTLPNTYALLRPPRYSRTYCGWGAGRHMAHSSTAISAEDNHNNADAQALEELIGLCGGLLL